MKIEVSNIVTILTTILLLGTISYMSSFRRPTNAYPLDPMVGGGYSIPSFLLILMLIWMMIFFTNYEQLKKN